METLIFAISCLLLITEGSYVVFEKSPDAIKTFFTPALSMRCSLHLHNTQNLSSPENAVYVTSLTISRNGGQQVASVLPFGSPQALVDVDKLNVSGHVSHVSDEQGLIVLTWQKPLADQAGNYTCEVNALNKAGHNLVFSETMEVDVAKPDMDDLIKHVHLVEVKNQELEAKLDRLMTSGGVASADVTHVEGGALRCPGDDGGHSVRRDFKASYPRPPLVHLGVTSFLSNSSAHTGDIVTGHYVTLGNVTRDSFVVTCAKTKSPYSFDYIAVVDWLSLPQ